MGIRNFIMRHKESNIPTELYLILPYGFIPYDSIAHLLLQRKHREVNVLAKTTLTMSGASILKMDNCSVQLHRMVFKFYSVLFKEQ